MPNATWPADIPQYFLASGLQINTVDDVIRTKPETGPIRTRRRTTLIRSSVTGRLRMTPAEFASFKTFFGTILAAGTLPFDWVMPDTQTAATFVFTGAWKATPHKRGTYWDVQIAMTEQP